jgi:hypothetical protein
MVTPPGGQPFMTAIMHLKEYPVSVSILPEGNVSICPGDSVLLTVQTEEGNRILWSNGQSGTAVYGVLPGQYFATSMNTSGCTSISQMVDLTFLPLPDNRIITDGDLSFCLGDSVHFMAVNEPGNTYLWPDGSVESDLMVKSEGNYYIEITGANGCQVTTSPIFVSVFPLPEANISYIGQPVICPGDSIMLTASLGENYHYQWSDGHIQQAITVYNEGSYSVIVTDSNGCNQNSTPVLVSVRSLTADLNLDGRVNTTDYLMVVGKFGTLCPTCREDFNLDQLVNTTDYLIVIAQYGFICH